MGPGIIAYLCWFVLLAIAIVIAVVGRRPSARAAAIVGSLLCWGFVSLVIGYYEAGGLNYLTSTAGLVTFGISLLGVACLTFAVVSVFRPPGA
jgi:hypothetical protein